MKGGRDETLIANLKYLLDIGGSRHDGSHLEVGIQTKKEEIQQLCDQNLTSILRHYERYYELKKKQKELATKVQLFNTKVQNFQKHDNNNAQEIETMAATVKTLDTVIQRAKMYKTFVEMAKRAVKSIEDEKYSNSIRFLNKLKDSQVLKLKKQTPMNRLLPIFHAKIRQHIDRLFELFGQGCQKKYLQFGKVCFYRVTSKEKERRTIYQALFSRMKDTRSSMTGSYINMNSSTVQFEDNRSSTLYDQSILPKALKKSQIHLTVRIKLDYSYLRQVQFIYTQMMQEHLFRYDLKQHGRNELKRLQKLSQNKNIKEFLVEMVGFLMVQRELIATFKLEDELKVLTIEIVDILKSKARSMRKNSQADNSQSILDMKETIMVFLQILATLNIVVEEPQKQSLLRELFKTYCIVRREQYSSLIQEMLEKDTHIKYRTDSEEEFKSIQKIIGLPDQKAQEFYEFPFTQIVPFISNMFSLFFEQAFGFIQEGHHDEEGSMHIQFQKMYMALLDNLSSYLKKIDNPLIIAQASANLHYLTVVFKWYSMRLELDHEVLRQKEYTCHEYEEKLKVQLALRTRQLIEHKIELQMMSYHEVRWMPNEVNKQHNQFLEWLLEYVYALVHQLREYELGYDKEIIYSMMTFMAQKYWEVLLELKEFNLQAIYNLNLDLVYLYKVLASKMSAYPNLVDKFKSLQQLVDYLLTGNLNDLQDQTKKRAIYPDLDAQKAISVLRLYQQGKSSSKQVRELKRKDVDAFLRRLT